MDINIKELGKHTIAYGYSRIVSVFASLILIFVLTKNFAPEEFGVISLLLIVVSILTGFLMMGFDSAIALHFHEAKHESEKKIIISTGFYFIVIASLLMLSILSAFTDNLSLIIFKEVKYNIFVAILFPIVFFSLINSFTLGLFQTLLKPNYYFYSTFSNSVLSVLFILYFVLKTDFGIKGVFYGYLFANVITSILGLYLNKSKFVISFSCKILKSLLKFGIPLVLASIAIFVLNTADRFAIIHFGTLREVGLYSLGFKIANIVLLLVGSFQLAWGPFAFSIRNNVGANKTYAKALKHFTIIACILSLAATIFSKELVYLLAGSQYVGAYIVVAPLTLAAVAYGSYFIVSLGVNLTKKTGFIAITSSLAAICNILLNLILIPNFGIIGAGISSVLSYCVSAYLLYLISQHYYPIPFNIKKIFLMWVLTIIFMSFGLAIDFNSLWLNLIAKLSIILLLLLSILYFKILKLDEIKLIFVFARNAFNKYILKKCAGNLPIR